jgi:hypothetical protein
MSTNEVRGDSATSDPRIHFMPVAIRSTARHSFNSVLT